MDSSELYHIKQQFTLGAYKSLVGLTVPPPSSPDYTQTLLYKARAHIALDDASTVLSLVPSDTSNVVLRAVASLAKYVSNGGEDALEELRDLCVEIDGEDADADEKDKGVVRVLAGTAFAREGEVEEALETLGAGSGMQNLEAVSLIVQIYLSINRPDLARKEFDLAKRWAEDDVLLQLIEASIGLVTGKDAYSDPNSFYTEQLGNPSLTSPHLLTARGVTRLLKGEIPAAISDFEEAVAQQGGQVDAETVAALVVAHGLSSKSAEVDQYWSQLTTKYPSHPLVVDIEKKSAEFDELAARFEVPPLAA